MLIGGVIHHQVDQQADAAFACLGGEFHEVAQAAQAGIDGVEVGDVIAVVAMRRRMDRIQPQAGHAQARQQQRLAERVPAVLVAQLDQVGSLAVAIGLGIED